MQILIPMTFSPKIYVSGNLHRKVNAPKVCPFCQAKRRLEAHGYYVRDTTDDDGYVLKIRVRRFQCRCCRATVSCLPHFAQPYRLVNSGTIDAYFSGHRVGFGIEKNTTRLKSYWKKFTKWAAQLYDIISPALATVPSMVPLALWVRMQTIGHGLAGGTLMLVRDFGVTFFGIYVCHQPPVHS